MPPTCLARVRVFGIGPNKGARQHSHSRVAIRWHVHTLHTRARAHTCARMHTCALNRNIGPPRCTRLAAVCLRSTACTAHCATPIPVRPSFPRRPCSTAAAQTHTGDLIGPCHQGLRPPENPTPGLPHVDRWACKRATCPVPWSSSCAFHLHSAPDSTGYVIWCIRYVHTELCRGGSDVAGAKPPINSEVQVPKLEINHFRNSRYK